jgi:hypothetical protein
MHMDLWGILCGILLGEILGEIDEGEVIDLVPLVLGLSQISKAGVGVGVLQAVRSN